MPTSDVPASADLVADDGADASQDLGETDQGDAGDDDADVGADADDASIADVPTEEVILPDGVAADGVAADGVAADGDDSDVVAEVSSDAAPPQDADVADTPSDLDVAPDTGCPPGTILCTDTCEPSCLEVIDPLIAAFSSAAIAITPSGDVHVVYDDADQDVLMHAQRAADGWDFVPVDVVDSAEVDLAVNGDGNPVVAFVPRPPAQARVYYGVFGAFGWSVSTALNASGDQLRGLRLAVNSTGEPRVSVSRATSGAVGPNDLLYLLRVDGSWIAETVASAVELSNLARGGFAVDASGTAHVFAAHWDGGFGDDLYHYTRQPLGWTVSPTPLATAVDASDVRACANAEGGVHVAFHDTLGDPGGGAVWVHLGTASASEQWPAFAQGTGAAHATVVVDSDGVAHAVAAGQGLRHRAYGGEAVVVADTSVFVYPDAAFDSDGTLHVVATNFDTDALVLWRLAAPE